ncbi:efflux RND transporter periplasmic adaptor subunit [uncultured Thiohalocapsa sp.]|uniref:efflux RND transporter periplasmic adaptor subunit n=1 Tax=uncultured Thiohalocapsa sp. TaxID=768990 RepID=UPI0025D48EFC|nr:efflux RND transporter periplasmic adaptor subunit [uncultured Thiohalocapsa sp.]
MTTSAQHPSTFPSVRCRLPSRRIVLLALLVGVAPPAAAQAPEGEGAKPPPAVVVAAVETQAVDKSARFIGNIRAIQSVDLKARVEGFLEDVAFQQGSMVDKGQVLYRIEQDQYKADLENAEGQLAAAQAESLAAAAALEDKQADFERQSALIKKGDTSQTAFDQAKAARDEAQANVQKAKASEQQAQAAVDNAKINLGYTTIASPIAGRIGATAVTEGNLVNGSTGTLATVAQLDPIRAVFSVPSAELIRLQDKVGASTTAEARAAFVPELVLPDGTKYDKPGKIAFADNQVDAATGTIAIYADFPNPSGVLLPGQFITVVVHAADKEPLPVVPAAAVQRTRSGAQVYLVDGDDRVQLRKVQLGPRVDGGYAVTSGLTDGELVIVSGLQKVKPGMTVQPSGADGAASGSGRDAGSGAASNGDSGSESGSETDGDGGTETSRDAGAANGDGTAGSAAATGESPSAAGNGG